jgi:hypothetical protein
MFGIIDSNQKINATNLLWNVDATQLRSYSGSGTTWTNLASVGLNGTLVNSPTFNSGNGGSIVFNGSNQYISTASQIITITSDWSVNVWYKTSGGVNSCPLVVRGLVGENIQWRCELQNSTGKISFTMRNPSDQTILGTTSTLGTGWHMATYTKNSSNLVTLYMDGVSENSGTITNFTDVAANIILGRLGNSVGPYYLNGNIGNVQLYSRTLSSDEVLNNFNAVKSRFGL